MANKHQVIALFKKRPDITSTEMGDILDCEQSYVRATLKRNGLVLAGSFRHGNPRLCRGVISLGRAARKAGFTVGDIERLAAASVNA